MPTATDSPWPRDPQVASTSGPTRSDAFTS